MTTDNFETADWTAFQATPETGDLKTLNELVARAGEIQAGLGKLAKRTKDGEALLKDLLENQIPELMKRSGMAVGDSITVAGFTVEFRENEYAGIPALSTIEKERDSDKRYQLEQRRQKAFRLLNEKAPALIKRTFEFDFERDAGLAEEFEKYVQSSPNADDFTYIKGETVHPRTLAKWVSEHLKEGNNLSVDELDTLGVYTRKVAKITTK